MAIQKITKRDNYKALLAIEAVSANQQLVDFINHELELLDKKSTSRKSSRDSEVNKKVREGILSILSTGNTEGMLASEILVNGIKAGVFDDTVTTPRITSVLGYLQDDKLVIRTTKGKKALFTLA